MARQIGALLVGFALLLFAALLQGTVLGFLHAYYWQAIMFSALLIGLAIYPMGAIVNRVTAMLGKLSYSIYLIHPVLIHALSPDYQKIYATPALLSVKWLLSVVVTVGLLIPLAYVCYRLVEKPGSAWDRSW